MTKALKKGLNDLKAATMWLVENAIAKPDNAGAAATDYLNLFGLVGSGYMGGLMAEAAGERDSAFFEGNRVTCRFFIERILLETALLPARIQAGADALMALSADAF